jgi:molybdopterin-guanine dinucleotide biosynthesis protein A
MIKKPNRIYLFESLILCMNGAILILAGGLSTRMGTNKINLNFKGVPMLDYTINRIKELQLPIYVSVHKMDSNHKRNDVNYIEDVYETPRSPLLGILSSLPKIMEDRLFITTADTPELNIKLTKYLLDFLSHFDSVIPMWDSGKPEIIHAAYNREKLLQITTKMWEMRKTEVSALLTRASNPLFISTEHLKLFDPELLSFYDFDTPNDMKNFFQRSTLSSM